MAWEPRGGGLGPGAGPLALSPAGPLLSSVTCLTLAHAHTILTELCFLSWLFSLSLVDFQIIRLVSEADLVFSPRGRTPVLWGLITRRDWPSTSPSKAQLLTSPHLLPPALPAQCSHF